MINGDEIGLYASEKYSLQRCKNRRSRLDVPQRKQRRGTLCFALISALIYECKGESGAFLKKELSLNGCAALANGNHTTPYTVASKQSSVEALTIHTRERKKKLSKGPTHLASSSKRQGILRIQREWRDAIKAGIAFEWAKGEARGKSAGPSHLWIGPVGSSLFTWHFSLTGVPGSAFENGVYHGRIVLPPDYPSTPPRIMLLTPSGRFIPGHDICLSASHYHPETWQPNVWSLRTLVESLRLHMCTAANEIGGLNDSYEKRLMYAQASRHWVYKIQHKNQSIWIDHGQMLERGFLPNGKEGGITKNGDGWIEDDAIDVQEIVETANRGESDASIVRKRCRKRKSLETELNGIVMKVIRQTVSSPLRMGILTFFLLFFYLNLF